MTCYHLVKITKSDKKDKKMMAIFEDCKTGRKKTTHFGSNGYEDFTTHKDEERKERYIARHRKNEKWNDPISAGSLAKHILWNKTSIKASIADYKRKFKFN